MSMPMLNIASLKAAGTAMLATGIGVEVTKGQAALATVLAFLSAVLAAYLASRPALMQAKIARDQLHNTEAAQTHAARGDFLEERIRYNSQVLVLTRESKHNLLNYTQELTVHIHKLRELVKAAEEFDGKKRVVDEYHAAKRLPAQNARASRICSGATASCPSACA